MVRRQWSYATWDHVYTLATSSDLAAKLGAQFVSGYSLSDSQTNQVKISRRFLHSYICIHCFINHHIKRAMSGRDIDIGPVCVCARARAYVCAVGAGVWCSVSVVCA